MCLTKIFVAGAVLLAAFAAVGCGGGGAPAGIQAPPPAAAGAPPPVRVYDYTHKVAIDAKRRPGQQWTVAILRFGDTRSVDDAPFGREKTPEKTGGGDVNVNVEIGARVPARPTQTPPQMNKRAREILKNALLKSAAFTVVERERILEIMREINFGKTKYVDPATAPAQGNLLGVRYLIEGSLGLNEDRTLKDTLDAKEDYRDETDPGPLRNIFRRGRANRRRQMAALEELRRRRAQQRSQRKFSNACYLSAYEVQTGRIMVSVMGLGTNGLEAIEDAVEELIDELTDKDDGLRIAAVIGDKVYLDIGKKGGIKTGQRFQIIHRGKEVRDRNGQIIGHDETEVGEIEVTEVRDLLSIAKVVRKVGKLSRGDLAKPAKH